MRAQASYTITAVKDGNDLDSILMLWKKTTTNAAPAKPSGTNLNGWSTDMPEFESGAYVWTCNRVAISDPTASTPIYTYTDPVLDTHWKKLDEVYKQGTEIKNTVDNITLKYYNSNGEETSFKLTNGAIDITLLKNQVDAAATTATNFISITDTGGIEVGKRDGEGWSGYRSQMLADSFNILDADGTILAKYGANDIHLGMNSSESRVYFCGDEATLGYNADENHMEIYTPDGLLIEGGAIIRRNYPSPNGVYNFKSGLDAYDSHVKLLSEIYTNGVRSAGSSITLSGNIMTLDADGYIFAGASIYGYAVSSSWYDGRDNALLRSTNNAGLGAWHPIISSRATSGTWDIGSHNNSFYFAYVPDSYYEDWTNDAWRICFSTDGSIIADGNITSSGNIGCGSVYLRAGGAYHVRFADDVEANVAYPYYESSGYKALMLGPDGNVINTIVMGKNIQFRSNGSSIDFMPYYGNTQNPYYWYITVGVVSTDIGPCIRPMTNNYCSVGGNGYGFRYVYATNTGIISTSDARLKENVSDDFSKLEKFFDMLRPVTYEYKHLENDDNMRIGLIAQEVQKALQECDIDHEKFAAIHTDKVDPESDLAKYLDSDETYHLNYTEFTALNTHMIQKLMKENESLRNDIIFFKKEIAGLKTEIVDFQKTVENLNKEISILKGVA